MLLERNCMGFSKEMEDDFAAAVRSSDFAKVQAYLKQGLSPQVNSFFLRPVPFVAVEENALDILKLLFEYGADPFSGDQFECNLLHISIQELDSTCSDKIVGYVNKNFEKDIQDNLSIIQYLLKLGVSLTKKDKWGDTPLDYIQCCGDLLAPILKPYLEKDIV